MILQESTTLQILLGGAITTNELPVTVSFRDRFITDISNGQVSAKMSEDDLRQIATTSGTSPIDILDAPDVSYKREVMFLSIYNADTVAATITIRYSDPKIVIKTTIQTGETLFYAEGKFYVIDVNGQIKTSLSSFAANIEDAINDGVTDKAPSENAVFDALALKIPFTYLDTDGTLAANSDARIASQKATKTYIDTAIATEVTNRNAAIASAVAGLMDYRGTFDASVNAYPSSGGSGTAGAILKSDFWIVDTPGTLPTGLVVEAGDLVIAKIDTPGNTQANWDIVQYNIGYTPENAANKSTDVNADQASNVKYPSVKAVYDWAVGLFAPIITAANFGSFVNGLTSKTTPVDADQVPLMDSAASNVLKKLSWANIKTVLFNNPNIVGTATNDNAAAGSVGEEITQTRLRSAATGMTTNTPLNVTATALTLTAGDWDVSAIVGYLAGTGTNATTILAAISLTSATLPGTDTIAVPTSGEVRINLWTSTSGVVLGTTSSLTGQISRYRVSLSATTTLYLVAQATFTISTLSAFGSITARRVR